MKHCLIAFLVLSSWQVASQSTHELLMNGDDQYALDNYSNAEEYYRKALQQKKDFKAQFNLGNALYQQERYEEATEQFDAAAQLGQEPELKSKAYYNYGNALFKSQELEKAAEAYKEAIRLDPSNREARYNLAATREMMRMMQKQEQQNQQQDNQENKDNQDKDKQEQEQNDQEKTGEDEQEHQSPEESRQDSTQNQSSSFDSSRLERQELDSLDARKLLEIIQNEELKVQEKLRKFKGNRKRPEKDW